MARCENCGCKSYNGACTNCHEEIYIEEQYHRLGEGVPILINELVNQQKEEIRRTK